jgi:hypothetical protein
MRHIVVCLLFVINVAYYLYHQNSGKKSLKEPSEQCIFIGGFYNENAINQLEQRFFSLAINPQKVVRKVDNAYDFLVYLEANQTNNIGFARDLRANNIDNAFILDGNLKDSISFGIFNNEANAIAKAQEIQKLGYEARVIQTPRVYYEYWLQITMDDKKITTDKQYTNILNLIKNTKEEFLPCNSIM